VGEVGCRLKLKNHAAKAGGVGSTSDKVVFRLKLKNHGAKAGGVGTALPFGKAIPSALAAWSFNFNLNTTAFP